MTTIPYSESFAQDSVHSKFRCLNIIKNKIFDRETVCLFSIYYFLKIIFLYFYFINFFLSNTYINIWFTLFSTEFKLFTIFICKKKFTE